MQQPNEHFPEQQGSEKVHGIPEQQENLISKRGNTDDVSKMSSTDDAGEENQDDSRREGHTREWQDRARVVLDAKKDAQEPASPNQSPVKGRVDEQEDVEEKSGRLNDDSNRGGSTFY